MEYRQSSKISSPVTCPYTVQSIARAAAILNVFSSSTEVLELRTVCNRTQLRKTTAFRILETLVEVGWLSRVGKHGYRYQIHSVRTKRFRIGYAALSNLSPFTRTVTESLSLASNASNVELLVLNNRYSPRLALVNADRFIAEKVDLVIDSQVNFSVAAQIAAKFSDAAIPFIAVDIPHPGAIYFGADNYNAGKMAGQYLARWTNTHWNGTANQIIFLGTDAAGPYHNARLTGMYDGICEVLPKAKNVPVCHFDTKGGQFEAALNVVRKHFRSRKPRRVLVGAVNDSTALATLQAFRELGLEEECAIIGQDASIEAREELRRSSRLVCSVAYFPETYGQRLVQLALDILNRKPIPPAVFTKHQLVTQENVNKIYPNDSWTN